MSNGDCQPMNYEKKRVCYSVIQHRIIEWKCPNCHKSNKDTCYLSAVANVSLECPYCGKCFIGESGTL